MIRTHDQPCRPPAARCAVAAHPAATTTATTPPRGGVPCRVSDRNCVAAIIFMARTSTPWALLPAKELGCGSATTCWRRLWTSGHAPGCSSSCRRWCWTSSARPAASTLGGSASTPSACGRSKGGPDRRKPSRSRQGRLQAPCGWRGGRAAGVAGHKRGQRQRLHHAGGGAGRHPGDPHAKRTASPAARQTLCRQGLRSSPLPGVSAPAWHPLPDRPAWDRVLGPAWPPPLEDRAHRAWLGGFRRLRIRYERCSERFYALAMLACSIICFNALRQPPWP
jgi:transposase